MDACDKASWDDAGAGDAEDDVFDGSFAGEDEEEAFNLAGTQPVNEALASEPTARRTVAPSESHHARHQEQPWWLLSPWREQERDGRWTRAKAKATSRDTRGQGRATAQLTSSSTSQAGMTLQKPRPVPVRPCSKCGSRDDESDKCPKNLEPRRYMARAWNFTAWCMGFDATYNTTSRDFRLLRTWNVVE